MLTGTLPFSGSNVEIAMASFRDAPPVMAARVPGLVVDPLLEALTRALLEKKPEARPRDANEVRELLDLIEADRDAAAARLGIVPKVVALAPEPSAQKHPATIAMWKLSRDPVAPMAEPRPPAPPEPSPAPSPAPPAIAPALTPLPIIQRAKARFVGSGTKLRTEAMVPVKASSTWQLLALVAGVVVLTILLALVLRHMN
jgi:hypothetical protein